MGLAIFQIAQGSKTTAYHTLERWLSIKYPQTNPPDTMKADKMDFGWTNRDQVHEKMTALFLQAVHATSRRQGDSIDVDLQIGLGLLFTTWKDTRSRWITSKPRLRTCQRARWIVRSRIGCGHAMQGLMCKGGPLSESCDARGLARRLKPEYIPDWVWAALVLVNNRLSR